MLVECLEGVKVELGEGGRALCVVALEKYFSRVLYFFFFFLIYFYF